VGRAIDRLDVTDLDYDLPEELIAQEPPERRTDARLMRVPRGEGALAHGKITDLVHVLRPGDLLVLNDTRVVPARVTGRRPTGGRLELLVVRAVDEAQGLWDVIVRGSPRLGEAVEVPGGTGHWKLDRGGGRWTIALDVGEPVPAWLDRVGTVPLPPYIRRVHGPDARDRLRYQTVVARRPGAVAAPTAGLHFTTELLGRLEAGGVGYATITLHVGPGTFLPVRSGSLETFEMEAEPYELSATAVDAINRTRAHGGRVVAVGTTTCRALESAGSDGQLRTGAGWASVFIRPGHTFRMTDGLLTNFHLPRTPLLALVSALTGWSRLQEAYGAAVRRGYRFYSYGDAMLVL